jgi:putative phosphoesterase
MRTLIVSDTHGRHEGLELALKREKPIDLLVHLGDIGNYADYYEALADCPLEAVAGNNDFSSDLPGEQVITVDGYRIFMTHGHYYSVHYDYRELVRAAAAHDCSYAMFGHIHRPVLTQIDGITVLNPGSLSYPRQKGRQRSYMVMTTVPGEKPAIAVHYLDPAQEGGGRIFRK